MSKNRTILLSVLSLAVATPAFSATLQPILYSDQTADAIFLVSDNNGDGDGNDAGETVVFFDENNASGLIAPTGNVFTMTQATDRAVFVGDGNTDSVYRLRDNNYNGTAQDKGEASLWFSTANEGGLSLNTPNGLAEGNDGAIYIVEADTFGNPSGDFIYRTEDLNNDGDANDAGEASVWVDLQALNAGSSAFEIIFIDEVAYVTDTAGGDPRVYRIEDTNTDGSIDTSTEVTTFIDNSNPAGQNVFSFALAALGESVLIIDLFTDAVIALTDLDDSGDINDVGEIMTLWDLSVFPIPPYEFGANFSLAVAPGEELLLTSNGSDPEEDFLLRLLDLNNNGVYTDDGETTFPLTRFDSGSLPIRPRSVVSYTAPVPLPAGLPLLLTALAAGALLRRRR